MTTNTLNRSAVRAALATDLAAVLVGAGLPAQTVYAYQVGDFGTENPVVVITSNGSDRSRFNDPDAIWEDVLYFAIHIFVLYALEDGSWTEEQSEDRLDLIEKTISDYVLAASAVGGGDEIWLDGRTTVEAPSIGGLDYRHEVIPVRVGRLHQS